MKLSDKQIREKITEVNDPELNISIVDLGLVYDIEQKNNKVKITMTLTSIGCPLFSLIEQEIKQKLHELGLTENQVELVLTFDPPWSMEKMSERAKATLGI